MRGVDFSMALSDRRTLAKEYEKPTFNGVGGFDSLMEEASVIWSRLSEDTRQALAVLITGGATNKELVALLQQELGAQTFNSKVLLRLRKLALEEPPAPRGGVAKQSVLLEDGDADLLQSLIEHSTHREKRLFSLFTHYEQLIQEKLETGRYVSPGLLSSLLRIADIGTKESRTAGSLLQLRLTDIETPLENLPGSPASVERKGETVTITVKPLTLANSKQQKGKLPKWQPTLPVQRR